MRRNTSIVLQIRIWWPFCFDFTSNLKTEIFRIRRMNSISKIFDSTASFRELCDKSRFKQLLQISFHNFTRTMFCVQSYSNFYSTNFHYYWLSWLIRESRKNLQQFLLPLPNSICNFTTWEFKISSDICQSSSRLILLARSYNRA